MSNTLNTPVEALETEFPVRVRERRVRRGSGGAGEHRGGDGHRPRARGACADGLHPDHRAPRATRRAGAREVPTESAGRNLLNGEPLPSKAAGELRPGDRLRLETPGGGGYGAPGG